MNPHSAASLEFQWLKPAELTPRITREWHDLSHAACTPNVFLAPEFVVPALRLLPCGRQPRIAAAWTQPSGQLVAIGIVETPTRSLRFPLRSLALVKSQQSFRTGLLLHQEASDQEVDAFLTCLFKDGAKALKIREIDEQSRVFERLMTSARRMGLAWSPYRRYERAALDLASGCDWRTSLSKRRRRNLRHARRKLAALGAVETRLVQGAEVRSQQIETFLRLENMGWKKPTSLLADPARAAFFRETVRNLSQEGGVFFAELSVNRHVIASLANFRLRDLGFTFKVGWDPAFAKFSPGVLVACGLMELFASRQLPSLSMIDGGGSPGSFLDPLWPARLPITSGYLVAGSVAQRLERAIGVAGRVRRRKEASAA